MVTRARMFQYKPDGEVTIMTFQDAVGTPITPFQDPLHYPHGTGFLAPGQRVRLSPRACPMLGLLGKFRGRDFGPKSALNRDTLPEKAAPWFALKSGGEFFRRRRGIVSQRQK